MTKNWVVTNNEFRGRYNSGSEIKFKTTVLRWNLCHFSNAYILVKRTMTITGAAGDAVARQ